MNSEALLRRSADEITQELESRVGRLHARRRLGKEKRHEERAIGQGLTFFHFENLPISHAFIEIVLRLSGTYWRGRRNAAKVRLRNNEVFSERLPPQFDGFTILHISDLHADIIFFRGPALTIGGAGVVFLEKLLDRPGCRLAGWIGGALYEEGDGGLDESDYNGHELLAIDVVRNTDFQSIQIGEGVRNTHDIGRARYLLRIWSFGDALFPETAERPIGAGRTLGWLMAGEALLQKVLYDR
jgi:hypothetical protein